jgi:hypothetical protein
MKIKTKLDHVCEECFTDKPGYKCAMEESVNLDDIGCDGRPKNPLQCCECSCHDKKEESAA